MLRVDAVVIGGGIAGASVAYELAARRRVALVEREDLCGYHTTGRSAALLTEAWETGIPGLLATTSRGFMEDPPDGFATAPLLRPLPTLIVAGDGDAPLLDALAESVSSRIDVERLTGADLRGACPVLEPTWAKVGLLERGSQEIDVAALHQGFLRGLRDRGGRVVTGAGVTCIDRRFGRWRVETAAGPVEGDVVVNAAGAWADEVASLAGLDPLDLQPMRRTAFVFAVPELDHSRWPFVIDLRERFYFKPERGQLLGSLCEETPMPPHDVRHEEIDVALAIERIEEATTLRVRHVARAWAGLRTFAPDRDPVNGFDPDAEGFYWLAGQGGFGIMTSPAMARAAAAIIESGDITADLAETGLSAESLSPARLRHPQPTILGA